MNGSTAMTSGTYIGGTGGGYGGPPAVLKPPDSNSKVRDAITATEQSTQELLAIISALEERLDAVLMPNPPAPGRDNVTTQNPIQSAVTARVCGLNNGCQHAMDRLKDIIRRLEV